MTVSRFPDAPRQIARLPVDKRGFPVPAFVTWIRGEPEFRVVDPSKIETFDRRGLCWVCGEKLLGLKAFVIGPMCCVNRLSAEPPVHLTCARFSVKACPFLSQPLAKRRPADDLPHGEPPGLMLARNPGVMAIWQTRSYRSERQPEGGLLFRIGPSTRVDWVTCGRQATREEVIESIRSGLPTLVDLAREEGAEAVTMLQSQVDKLGKLLPA